MAFAERTEVFDVEIEKVYQILTDYSNYSEFMDGVKSVEVLSRDGNKLQAEYHLSIIKKFNYTINLIEEAPTKLSWTFESGDFFSKNNGSWTLTDLGNGKTEVAYHLDVEFKVKVPGMISRKLVSSNLPSMMKSVCKRAKAL